MWTDGQAASWRERQLQRGLQGDSFAAVATEGRAGEGVAGAIKAAITHQHPRSVLGVNSPTTLQQFDTYSPIHSYSKLSLNTTSYFILSKKSTGVPSSRYLDRA